MRATERIAIEAAVAALGLEVPRDWNGVDELFYDLLPHGTARVEAGAIVVTIVNSERHEGLDTSHVRSAEAVEGALERAGVVGSRSGVLGRIFDFTSWDERGWIRLERGEKVRFSAEVCVGFEPEVDRWVLVEIADARAKTREAVRVTAAAPPEPKRFVHRVWPPPEGTRVVPPVHRSWPAASHWPQPLVVHEPLDREAVVAAHPQWCEPMQAIDLSAAFRLATCPALPHPFFDPWRESIAAITAAASVGRPDERPATDARARVGASAVRLVGEWPTCTVCGAAMQLLVALPASTMRELGMPSEELTAFTCPACHVGPWKDLLPSGMVAVRWAGADAELVPHPEVAGTRAASGLELIEAPTLPVLGTIMRWLAGGAARELLANTLVSTEDGLADLDGVWNEWTTGPAFPYGVQIGGYPRWFSGEARGRACPTCSAPLRLIAWMPEYVLAGAKSRERDLVLFACNRPGCDAHRVELSYERDG